MTKFDFQAVANTQVIAQIGAMEVSLNDKSLLVKAHMVLAMIGGANGTARLQMAFDAYMALSESREQLKSYMLEFGKLQEQRRKAKEAMQKHGIALAGGFCTNADMAMLIDVSDDVISLSKAMIANLDIIKVELDHLAQKKQDN